MLTDQPTQPLAEEDRLEQVEVRQVRAALVRVVEQERVARLDPSVELADDLAHRVRDRAEVERQGQPLGDEPALRVAQRATTCPSRS